MQMVSIGSCWLAAGGEGRRVDLADVDGARRNRGDYVGAAAELVPGDIGAGRLLILAGGLRHPGATATEFHPRAGMGATGLGDDSWKNDPAEVARQGYEALRRGDATVTGGDAKTQQAGSTSSCSPRRRRFVAMPHAPAIALALMLLQLTWPSVANLQEWVRSDRTKWPLLARSGRTQDLSTPLESRGARTRVRTRT